MYMPLNMLIPPFVAACFLFAQQIAAGGKLELQDDTLVNSLSINETTGRLLIGSVAGKNKPPLIAIDVRSEEVLRVPFAGRVAAFATAISIDGTVAAVGGISENGPLVQLYNAATNMPMRRLEFNSERMEIISEDLQLSTSIVRKLPLQRNSLDGAHVSVLAFSPDGGLLAVGFKKGRSQSNSPIVFWSFDADAPKASVVGHGSDPVSTVTAVTDCCFTSDSQLLSGGTDGSLRLWNISDSRMIAEVAAHDGPVLSVGSVDPGGRCVSSGQRDGMVKLCRIATSEVVWTNSIQKEGPIHMAVSSVSASAVICACGADGTLHVLREKDGTVQKSLLLGGASLLEFSDMGHELWAVTMLRHRPARVQWWTVEELLAN